MLPSLIKEGHKMTKSRTSLSSILAPIVIANGIAAAQEEAKPAEPKRKYHSLDDDSVGNDGIVFSPPYDR
jgi:hypothetical protein